MACFIVPGTEAVVTTVVTKVVEKKEAKNGENGSSFDGEKFSKKLKRLNNLLWGGSFLLAFEHLWHGEISLAFPFLTAMKSAEDASVMLHEMSTVGVGMAALITAIWGASLVVVKAIDSKKVEDEI